MGDKELLCSTITQKEIRRGMALPSRDAVTEFLTESRAAQSISKIADALAVPEKKRAALLRMLDAMAQDGLLHGEGEAFRLAIKGGAHEPVAVPKAKGKAKRSVPPPVVEKLPKRAKKALPADFGTPMPGFNVSADKHSRNGSSPPRDLLAGRNPAGSPPRDLLAHRGAAPQAGEGLAPADGTRIGVIRMNQRGFGFVESPGAKGQDVFVSQEALGGAMHGDTVRVRVIGRRPQGLEGHVEEVITRSVMRVGGILRRKGNQAWVEPDDARVRGPVVLTSPMDATAGEGNSGEDGDAVVAQITRFPEDGRENPEGKLVAVLGRPGVLSVETHKIVMVAGIAETHTDAAISEAELYGIEVPKEMLEGRVDLTHIPLPTIDPADARDHDDAVWVERTADGGYKAWIAIADVSTYVRPGTLLDQEALERGCSVYLPERAIPMLPRALSSNLCSLLPDVIRLCLCAEVTLDKNAIVQDVEIHRAFMKSAAKLTYDKVARTLEMTLEGDIDPVTESYKPGLRVAEELSLKLRAHRMQRGALDFNLPEAKIVFNEEKQPVDVQKRGSDPGIKKAYQLIEELMLLANEVVAQYLAKKDVPAVYRVHLPPDALKLERLAAMCTVLGVNFGAEDAANPKALGAFLKRVEAHPQASVLHGLLLRSMKQATYDTENQGHFGLASAAYVHFTSPIRRYPDVIVHRLVHALLQGTDPKSLRKLKTETQESAVRSSISERRAMEVERDVMNLYRCEVMRPHIGDQFDAKLSSVVGSGVFASIDSPFVDVMVRSEDLGPEGMQPDDDGLRVVSRSGDSLALGETFQVEIVDVSLTRRIVSAVRIGAPKPSGVRKSPGARGQGFGDNQPRGQAGFGATRGRGGVPSRHAKDGGGAPPRRKSEGDSRAGYGAAAPRDDRGGAPARGPARGSDSRAGYGAAALRDDRSGSSGGGVRVPARGPARGGKPAGGSGPAAGKPARSGGKAGSGKGPKRGR